MSSQVSTPTTSPGVALIKALYQAFGEEGYATFRNLCTPDIEWVQNVGFPGGATYRGVDAIIAGVFQGNARRWEGFGVEISEILDAGTSVVVVGHYHGHHRESGRSFRAAVAHVYDLRDGRVCRFRMFADTKTLWDSLPSTQG